MKRRTFLSALAGAAATTASAGPKLGFLMYPRAETAEGRLDCLDPDDFRYRITAREIVA